MSYQPAEPPAGRLSTAVATIMAAVLVGWLIHALLQLKPAAAVLLPGPTSSDTTQTAPAIPKPDSGTLKSVAAQRSTVAASRSETPLNPIANTLNALLHDYFTTSFDEESQARWRYQLSAGSPYLSELAAYLKLDRLYDMALYPSANRQMTDQYRADAPLDDSRASLFNMLNHHADEFWPMSIIAGDPTNTYREKLLLNHYDRDFLVKIERGGFAGELAPLAPGIQRLLEFHLKDAVAKSAGLRIDRRARSIDQSVSAFEPFVGDGTDVFRFYNAVLKREWSSATERLMTAPGLQHDRYDFLYDLVAIGAPEALLQQVTLNQYQRRYRWWDQFFYFEACLNRNRDWLETLNRRLSIQLSCSDSYAAGIPDVTDLPDPLIADFWDQILTPAELTETQIDAFYTKLDAMQRDRIVHINSHTLIDFLARKGRLRVIRNTSLYQRIELNYQLWQRRFQSTHTDTFYQYSPLLHWFSNRRFNDSELHQRLSQLMPSLSTQVQDSMADQLLDHLESAGIHGRNWSTYEPLAVYLNDEERYLLRRFAQMQPDLALSAASAESNLSPAAQTRLDQAAMEMVFNARLWVILDNAYRYDDFLLQGEQLIRSLANEYRDSRFADSLTDTLNDSNRLSRRALRHFDRLWHSVHSTEASDR